MKYLFLKSKFYKTMKSISKIFIFQALILISKSMNMSDMRFNRRIHRPNQRVNRLGTTKRTKIADRLGLPGRPIRLKRIEKKSLIQSKKTVKQTNHLMKKTFLLYTRFYGQFEKYSSKSWSLAILKSQFSNQLFTVIFTINKFIKHHQNELNFIFYSQLKEFILFMIEMNRYSSIEYFKDQQKFYALSKFKVQNFQNFQQSIKYLILYTYTFCQEDQKHPLCVDQINKKLTNLHYVLNKNNIYKNDTIQQYNLLISDRLSQARKKAVRFGKDSSGTKLKRFLIQFTQKDSQILKNVHNSALYFEMYFLINFIQTNYQILEFDNQLTHLIIKFLIAIQGCAKYSYIGLNAFKVSKHAQIYQIDRFKQLKNTFFQIKHQLKNHKDFLFKIIIQEQIDLIGLFFQKIQCQSNLCFESIKIEKKNLQLSNHMLEKIKIKNNNLVHFKLREKKFSKIMKVVVEQNLHKSELIKSYLSIVKLIFDNKNKLTIHQSTIIAVYNIIDQFLDLIENVEVVEIQETKYKRYKFKISSIIYKQIRETLNVALLTFQDNSFVSLTFTETFEEKMKYLKNISKSEKIYHNKDYVIENALTNDKNDNKKVKRDSIRLPRVKSMKHFYDKKTYKPLLNEDDMKNFNKPQNQIVIDQVPYKEIQGVLYPIEQEVKNPKKPEQFLILGNTPSITFNNKVYYVIDGVLVPKMQNQKIISSLYINSKVHYNVNGILYPEGMAFNPNITPANIEMPNGIKHYLEIQGKLYFVIKGIYYPLNSEQLKIILRNSKTIEIHNKKFIQSEGKLIPEEKIDEKIINIEMPPEIDEYYIIKGRYYFFYEGIYYQLSVQNKKKIDDIKRIQVNNRIEHKNKVYYEVNGVLIPKGEIIDPYLQVDLSKVPEGVTEYEVINGKYYYFYQRYWYQLKDFQLKILSKRKYIKDNIVIINGVEYIKIGESFIKYHPVMDLKMPDNPKADPYRIIQYYKIKDSYFFKFKDNYYALSFEDVEKIKKIQKIMDNVLVFNNEQYYYYNKALIPVKYSINLETQYDNVLKEIDYSKIVQFNNEYFAPFQSFYIQLNSTQKQRYQELINQTRTILVIKNKRYVLHNQIYYPENSHFDKSVESKYVIKPKEINNYIYLGKNRLPYYFYKGIYFPLNQKDKELIDAQKAIEKTKVDIDGEIYVLVNGIYQQQGMPINYDQVDRIDLPNNITEFKIINGKYYYYFNKKYYPLTEKELKIVQRRYSILKESIKIFGKRYMLVQGSFYPLNFEQEITQKSQEKCPESIEDYYNFGNSYFFKSGDNYHPLSEQDKDRIDQIHQIKKRIISIDNQQYYDLGDYLQPTNMKIQLNRVYRENQMPNDCQEAIQYQGNYYYQSGDYYILMKSQEIQIYLKNLEKMQKVRNMFNRNYIEINNIFYPIEYKYDETITPQDVVQPEKINETYLVDGKKYYKLDEILYPLNETKKIKEKVQPENVNFDDEIINYFQKEEQKQDINQNQEIKSNIISMLNHFQKTQLLSKISQSKLHTHLTILIEEILQNINQEDHLVELEILVYQIFQLLKTVTFLKKQHYYKYNTNHLSLLIASFQSLYLINQNPLALNQKNRILSSLLDQILKNEGLESIQDEPLHEEIEQRYHSVPVANSIKIQEKQDPITILRGQELDSLMPVTIIDEISNDDITVRNILVIESMSCSECLQDKLLTRLLNL